jgi:hypothetical protein
MLGMLRLLISFTGDEHRFKVLLKNFDDDSIIW